MLYSRFLPSSSSTSLYQFLLLKFTPRKTCMRMNLDHVASSGETFISSSIVGHCRIGSKSASNKARSVKLLCL